MWVNFTVLERRDDKGDLLCQYKRCGKVYNAESNQGTGNLKRHLKTCSKRTYKDVGKMIINASSSGSMLNGLPTFDPDVFRDLLSIAIVKHDLPFQFVEYDGVKKCFSYLNPDINM